MSDAITNHLEGHFSRMYRVALRIAGDTDAAQEIAQEACVKALRGRHEFNGRADPATWLHRITVNCAHDYLRKNRRFERGRTDLDSGAAGMLAMVDVGPAERLERDEAYEHTLSLVAKLPDDCRLAFLLTQLDGYSYDEAAAIEDVSRGTVASRVYRARQILMRQLNHHQSGDMP